ncbi:RHS repeat-associated core domain-containing protein [Pseudomonas sp. BW13M1]|uniref:RHS repeat-associated core domain-containing protein n=1 Tax=Pseudomonas peradeniyensis TaxID=2745488 RepID=A0A923JXE0_9PSED|nr:RHS repeat-associated core domain-containing protein [Pseudomonas peradeniyensis]MBV4506560.1 RHS repeat-associated core domain-containing protein [Pseudomonas peradeniyensis]
MSSTLLAVDRLHSPLARFGASNSIAAYLPYGHKHGLVDKPRLGFTGQLCEPVVGWYSLGNGYRVYNPVLMCFHSPDRLSPFGKGGINTYAYCVRDPINRADPSGRFGSQMATIYLGGKVSLDLINIGLKWWRQKLTKSTRPWTDPMKYVEITSRGLKVFSLATFGTSEIVKRSASDVTDPADTLQIMERDSKLNDADTVRGVAMLAALGSNVLDMWVNIVDVDRARHKKAIAEDAANVRGQQASSEEAAMIDIGDADGGG